MEGRATHWHRLQSQFTFREIQFSLHGSMEMQETQAAHVFLKDIGN